MVRCPSFFILSLTLTTSLFSIGCSSSVGESEHPHAHSHTDHSHAEPGEEASVYPDRVTLTWAQDPTSSLSVSWRTDTTVTTPKAQIAPASPSPSFDVNPRTVNATTHPLDVAGVDPDSVTAPYHYHSVTFEHLQPDSTYAYRVGDGSHWSEWFHAETAGNEPQPFSFIYLGDAQNDIRSHWSRAIRAAYSTAPEAAFMVHVGDLVNWADRNVQWGQWHEGGGWIQSTMPTLPVPGNREYADRGSDWSLPTGSVSGEYATGRQLSAHWRPQFELPKNGPKGLEEQVYELTHQGLHLIGLDPMAALVDSTKLQQQTRWLESVLSESEARWTTVAMHIPIFSTVGDYEPLRKAWKPLFDEYQVDLVMQGHNHNYARGQVQNVAQGANARSPSSGTVYVTSVAGPKMLKIQEKGWTDYEEIEIERSAENTQLFQIVHVNRDTMKYRAYTVTGERYDAFDLVKQPGDEPNELLDSLPADPEDRSLDNTIREDSTE